MSTGKGSAIRAKALQTTGAADVASPLEQYSAYPRNPEEREQCRARIHRRFDEALAAAPAGARQLVDDLRGLGVDEVDVFHGSHVVIDGDAGALYDRWIALGAHSRTAPSSHYPDVKTPQYEMDLPGIGVALFGKTASGQTWVQVEAHTGSDLLHHGIDAAVHFASLFAGAVNKALRDHGLPAGEGDLSNVGPAGLSPHSEKNGRELVVKYEARR
jgi:hypothetical protein